MRQSQFGKVTGRQALSLQAPNPYSLRPRTGLCSFIQLLFIILIINNYQAGKPASDPFLLQLHRLSIFLSPIPTHRYPLYLLFRELDWGNDLTTGRALNQWGQVAEDRMLGTLVLMQGI